MYKTKNGKSNGKLTYIDAHLMTLRRTSNGISAYIEVHSGLPIILRQQCTQMSWRLMLKM